MASNRAILYSFYRSSCSWRVRLALNLKRIPYDIRPINIDRGGGKALGQITDEFTKINPMQQVPVLLIDNRVLRQSLNILYYLEETRPEPPLVPSDLGQKLQVRELSELIVSGIQPLQNVGVLDYISDKDKSLEWAQYWIKKGFVAVEKLLAGNVGKYCMGDQLTLADCCLIPQVFNARRYKVNIDCYPTIFRIDKALKSHPDFLDTHPKNQPDCPRTT